VQAVPLTAPNLALAAPLLTPSATATVALTAPNVALAAPLVTPGVGQSVALTAPNLALAAPLLTPSAGATVALTAPNVALAAPLVTPPAAGPPPPFPDPAAQLPVRLEVNAGGTWVNVTSDLDHGPMTVGRGHPDESTTVSPATFSATLTNKAARYSPDNVMSDLWPWCVQNMPVRASIPATVNYLRLEDASGDYATAADSAGLHVTGSVEMRIALRLSDWQGCVLAHKWDGGSCWAWLLNGNGTMTFFWIDSGVVEHVVVSVTPLPMISGDFALKVTLDVTTGTVTYYTAATIDGTYTAVEAGSSGTGGAATSLRSTTAPLSVGYEAVKIFSPNQLLGRVYEYRLYNGIGGTVVADGIFSAQSAGATTWTDPQANTWSLSGGAEISDRRYRGHFEASEWPQEEPEYNPDVTNKAVVAVDALVPLVGGGLLRRLGQRAPNVQSAMYRAVLTQSGLVAYWPMEDAAGSSSFGSAVGGLPMGWSGGPPVLAKDTSFACSAPLPVVSGAQIGGGVPAYTGGTAWSVRFLAKVPTLPGSSQILVQVCTTGGVAPYITLIINSDGTVTLSAYAADGVTVVATTGSMSWFGGCQAPQLWSIEATASGSNVNYAVSSVAPGASLGATGNVTTAATGAAGYVGLVLPPPFSGVWSDVVMGHAHVRSVVDSVFSLGGAVAAHIGEPAGTRFARLCGENSIPCRTRGNLADTTLMGVQPAGTLVTLLQACADADQGVWTELRQVLGWGYVTRKALYSQPATATVSYLSDHLSMWSTPPARDDQVIVNDVTFTNDSGSSYRAFAAPGQPITGGRMSTLPPASGGVGTYAQPYSASLASDAQLPDVTGWKLHLGTVDQARLPGITSDLANAAATSIYDAVLDLDLGDRLVISNPPRRLGFEPVTLLVQAVSETLGYDTLTIGIAGVPELPYQVWQQTSRIAPNAAVLSTGVNTTATSWSVAADSGDATQLWSVVAGDYPQDWVIDGERVTVTAVTGGSSPQTATVTRSVNGVVKSHLANAAITLWPPPVIGL
jgi:hypothetical protein